MRDVFSVRALIVFLFMGNVASAAYIVTIKLGKPKIEPVKTKFVKKNDPKLLVENYRNEIVRSILAEKNQAIEECYESFLKTEPEKTRGAIRVSWIINKDGNVTDLKLLGSDLKNENLENCVFHQVKSAAFSPPPLQEDVQVAHKFKFQSRSPANIEF